MSFNGFYTADPAAENNFIGVVNDYVDALLGRTRSTYSTDKYDTIDKECGYPTEVTLQMCLDMFRRSGAARRAVNIYGDESWAMTPDVYESVDPKQTTEWEKKFNSVVNKHKIWNLLHKLDNQSGIGRFSIMVFGLNDGTDLSKPVRGFKADGTRTASRPSDLDISYIQTFDEGYVKIAEVETDKTSPRFQQPTMYEICYNSNVDGTASDQPAPEGERQDVKIHWTRVFHLAGWNRRSSNTYAEPILESCYNYFLDIKKVAGGSAEMFWKGGFPGISFEADPSINLATVNIDTDKLKEQIRLYSKGLQRYMQLIGVKANSLDPQVADPTNHLDIQLRLVAMALGVPYRIFLGSEAAHLASTQDIGTWNKRLNLRRSEYIWPWIIKGFIQCLTNFGILPETEEEIKCDWPDLNAPTLQDRANISAKITNAMQQYVTGNLSQIMDPVDFYTEICGFSKEKAEILWQNAIKFRSSGIKIEPAQPKTPAGAAGRPGGSQTKKRTSGK